MDKRIVFYGTPLTKVLNKDEEASSRDGPATSRRARLDRQQVVKDDQGRRRFHGAFTGGFSAGYYNTVDSVEGFRPKQFVSHRKDRKNHGESSSSSETTFSQRPEDFMDDEDLSEFGIAPKKIRVNQEYGRRENPFSKLTSSNIRSLYELIQPSPVSIGEKILKILTATYGVYKFDEIQNLCNIEPKNDFHGLGYKPIVAKQRIIASADPLRATIERGKRLEISGEAFGSGVLDDDEDYLDNVDSYGYDDIKNYEFAETKSAAKTKTHQKTDNVLGSPLPGFVLAKNLDIAEEIDCDIHREPQIPDYWRTPTRDEPYVPPTRASSSGSKIPLDDKLFSKKFTTGTSELMKSDTIEGKSGLLSYRDLKATEPDAKCPGQSCVESEGVVDDNEPSAKRKVTIKRQTVEWRPCSLLCKRFGVPSPYPDSSYCGVNKGIESEIATNLKANHDSTSDWINIPSSEPKQQLAPLELRRSIFNIVSPRPDDLKIKTMISYATINSDTSDEDSDVLVVPVARQEPELVVISSSSSSSSPLSDANVVSLYGHQDVDSYGPELPPDLDPGQQKSYGSPSRSTSSRRKRKKSKGKKHKRHRYHEQ